MQMSEHGVFQCDSSLLLERLEGLGVVMLSEVFQTEADGFLFSVLQPKHRHSDSGEGPSETQQLCICILNDGGIVSRCTYVIT